MKATVIGVILSLLLCFGLFIGYRVTENTDRRSRKSEPMGTYRRLIQKAESTAAKSEGRAGDLDSLIDKDR